MEGGQLLNKRTGSLMQLMRQMQRPNTVRDESIVRVISEMRTQEELQTRSVLVTTQLWQGRCRRTNELQ